MIQDLYTILPFIDCLITDYSATYHDFLLSNKPIFFIPYDYEEYEEQNGFLYDYQNLLPGPIIGSLNDFLLQLEKLCNGIDDHSNKRLELRTLIHKYVDGNSSRRVFALIDSLG